MRAVADIRRVHKENRSFPGREIHKSLNWSIRGHKAWQQRGLGEPDEIKENTEQYRKEMDSIEDFVHECCVVNPNAKVPVGKLFKEYSKHCDTKGDIPLQQNDFKARLQERELDKKPGAKGFVYWLGIGLMKTQSAGG